MLVRGAEKHFQKETEGDNVRAERQQQRGSEPEFTLTAMIDLIFLIGT